MNKPPESQFQCSTCGQQRHLNDLAVGASVRESVVAEIRREHPDWSANQPVCFECLSRFRAEHIRKILEDEKGELSILEEQVVESLREQDSVSANVNEEFDRELTVGERLSDHLATFGGSWTFLILFGCAMLVWITINTTVLRQTPFDPFPFILLNLLLSCLAAIQAPIIMMSQNRQETKDRLRSEHDYRVNLKAEVEIRLLNTKVDQLLTHQWQRLMEIQQLQMELMEEVATRERRPRPGKPPG